jgi:hypothetical protein
MTTQDLASDDPRFDPLDDCCYIRQGTMNGRNGWMLLDCDGEVEVFSEERSQVFFYAQKHDMKVIRPN